MQTISLIEFACIYKKDLWAYCYKITQNKLDAEDLLQDTLLKAYLKQRHIDLVSYPKAYLFKIACNLWLRSKKNILLNDSNFIKEEIFIENISLSYDFEQLITWLFSVLPPKQAVAFILSNGYDLSNKDIAEIFGTSIGTIKSYIHRAKCAIRCGTPEIIQKKSCFTERPVKKYTPCSKLIHAIKCNDIHSLTSLLNPMQGQKY